MTVSWLASYFLEDSCECWAEYWEPELLLDHRQNLRILFATMFLLDPWCWLLDDDVSFFRFWLLVLFVKKGPKGPKERNKKENWILQQNARTCSANIVIECARKVYSCEHFTQWLTSANNFFENFLLAEISHGWWLIHAKKVCVFFFRRNFYSYFFFQYFFIEKKVGGIKSDFLKLSPPNARACEIYQFGAARHM